MERRARLRIVIATVGTTGDVRPFIVLGRHLAAIGHDLSVVTWPVHRDAFERAGLRVETAGPHADPERIAAVAAEAATRGPLDQVAVLRDFHLADGAAHYRRLRELLPGHDLVILHGIHSLAHAAAVDTGCRWVTAVFDPVLLPTASAPPPGMPGAGPLNRVAWWMLERMLARVGRPLDEALRQAGSSLRGLPLFRARSPLLHLVACSPSIVDVPPDLPAATRFTGAWLDAGPPEALPPELDAFLAAGDSPIVITFGSMGESRGATVEAAIGQLVADGRRIVVQGGTSVPGPNVLAIGPADHRALFPRTSVVVHHGGAGTTHAACAAGVPSVVVPHVGDQRYWAERLWRLGVAPRPLPASRLDGAALAEATCAASDDPAFGAAARELAGRLAAEDGVAAAVSALEAAGA